MNKSPYLRPWRQADAGTLLAARASAGDLAAQFGGVELAGVQDAERYIADTLVFTGAAKNWAIVVGGRAVGNVGLSDIEQRHNTAWAHYWLAAGIRGKGLATRALASVAAWAFGHGVFRIELGHRTNNPASGGVAVRAGFVAEGVERQKLRYGDARYDVATYARLATDAHPGIELLDMLEC